MDMKIQDLGGSSHPHGHPAISSALKASIDNLATFFDALTTKNYTEQGDFSKVIPLMKQQFESLGVEAELKKHSNPNIQQLLKDLVGKDGTGGLINETNVTTFSHRLKDVNEKLNELFKDLGVKRASSTHTSEDSQRAHLPKPFRLPTDEKTAQLEKQYTDTLDKTANLFDALKDEIENYDDTDPNAKDKEAKVFENLKNSLDELQKNEQRLPKSESKGLQLLSQDIKDFKDRIQTVQDRLKDVRKLSKQEDTYWQQYNSLMGSLDEPCLKILKQTYALLPLTDVQNKNLKQDFLNILMPKIQKGYDVVYQNTQERLTHHFDKNTGEWEGVTSDVDKQYSKDKEDLLSNLKQVSDFINLKQDPTHFRPVIDTFTDKIKSFAVGTIPHQKTVLSDRGSSQLLEAWDNFNKGFNNFIS